MEANPPPTEETENQIWGVLVDGWGGGKQYTADWSMEGVINPILTIIIVIAVIALTVYILYKYYIYKTQQQTFKLLKN
jgi:hypothetical protein